MKIQRARYGKRATYKDVDTVERAFVGYEESWTPATQESTFAAHLQTVEANKAESYTVKVSGEEIGDLVKTLKQSAAGPHGYAARAALDRIREILST